jgi:hypothetical protein
MDPPKRRLAFEGLHGVIPQNIHLSCRCIALGMKESPQNCVAKSLSARSNVKVRTSCNLYSVVMSVKICDCLNIDRFFFLWFASCCFR